MVNKDGFILKLQVGVELLIFFNYVIKYKFNPYPTKVLKITLMTKIWSIFTCAYTVCACIHNQFISSYFFDWMRARLLFVKIPWQDEG